MIILIELARGTHLLFSLYVFSHTVPFYHFPSGSGCLSSHCPDKAEGWLLTEDQSSGRTLRHSQDRTAQAELQQNSPEMAEVKHSSR